MTMTGPGPAISAGTARVAPANDSPPSSGPLSTSGRTPVASARPREEGLAVGGVADRRGRHQARPLDAVLRHGGA